MPAPIIPAPSTPTFAGRLRGTSRGRDWPDLIALRSKKKALIIAFAFAPVASFARCRLSMRSAVSKSTSAPSTITASAASAAG